MTAAVLVDSCIPLYALGAASPWREPCRRVLARLASGELTGLASTEMIQEVVHHRLRVTGDRSLAVADGRDVSELVTVIAFDEVVLAAALSLIERHGTIRGRDAVHAATAITQGVAQVVSIDPAFDDVPGLTRLVPEASAS